MMGQRQLQAVIFDLDGVVTKTALVHAASWKVMFDEFLQQRAEQEGIAFVEFTIQEDYRMYVDGKPRYKGVASFLESRSIELPFGYPSDNPDQQTVCGLGNRKNIKFREVLERDGVELYPTTVALIRDLRAQGVRVGVASSSKNCQFVLQAAAIEELFETRVDGVVSVELGLEGKPQGDIFVKAAENLNVDPVYSAVVEDAVSGVQAGVNGGFGLVIGVDREGHAAELTAHGADIVVNDFQGVRTEQVNAWLVQNQNSH